MIHLVQCVCNHILLVFHCISSPHFHRLCLRYESGLKLADKAMELANVDKSYRTAALQQQNLFYNCLGIDYGRMGKWQEALVYHTKHLNNGDMSGKFVAHCKCH